MARFKNALTKYEVAEMPVGEAAASYVELAHYISEVTNDTEETVESTAYYSGDGTPEDDISAIKPQYGFVGTYDETDAAMALIAGKALQTGEARKIMFKVTHTDGKVFEGPATVSNIKYTGGAASDFAPFECTIAFNRIPTVTPAAPQG